MIIVFVFEQEDKTCTSTELIFLFKGIISRDFMVCFWYHLIDLKFVHIRSGFICFHVEFFIFASRRSEPSLRVANLLGFPQLLS
jgi:hypothetical protein